MDVHRLGAMIIAGTLGASALCAACAPAEAAWHLHSTTYTVLPGDTLTSVAEAYVNSNTPLRIYREGLKELNYDLLKDRADQDVRVGDQLVVNFWTEDAD